MTPIESEVMSALEVPKLPLNLMDAAKIHFDQHGSRYDIDDPELPSEPFLQNRFLDSKEVNSMMNKLKHENQSGQKQLKDKYREQSHLNIRGDSPGSNNA